MSIEGGAFLVRKVLEVLSAPVKIVSQPGESPFPALDRAQRTTIAPPALRADATPHGFFPTLSTSFENRPHAPTRSIRTFLPAHSQTTGGTTSTPEAALARISSRRVSAEA